MRNSQYSEVNYTGSKGLWEISLDIHVPDLTENVLYTFTKKLILVSINVLAK